MTKPAKPGSLRKHIEDKISAIQGYENLDKIMRGERADYLLFNRKVIIEQKEFENSPQHNKKGALQQNYTMQLFAKYGIDPYSRDQLYLQEKHKLLSQEEAGQLDKLRDDFYNKIKVNMHKANSQIGATQRVLGLPNAVGVVLMVFDKINGMMPAVIRDRVTRTFDTLENGEPSCKHVDIVIFALWMKGMSYDGAEYLNGHITRNGSTEHTEYARSILDGLKEGQTQARARRNLNAGDMVDQLVPDVFSE